MVRFADSFGLELEKVKVISNNSFVDAFSFANVSSPSSFAASSFSSTSSPSGGSSPYVDGWTSVAGSQKSKSSNTGGNTSSNDPLFNSLSTKPFLVLIPLFGLRKMSPAPATNSWLPPYNNSNTNNNNSNTLQSTTTLTTASTPPPVRLDDYVFDYENKLIQCVIRVKNLSFDKRVFARITFNSWKTHYDLDAMYQRSEPTISNSTSTSNANPSNAQQSSSNYISNLRSSSSSSNPIIPVLRYDFFGFCILLPASAAVASSSSLMSSTSSSTVGAVGTESTTLLIEFAICYQWNAGEQEYWDNNFGENYKFQCIYNK